MLTKIWIFIKRDPLRRGVALAFALFLYAHLNFQLTAEHRLIRVRVPVTLTLSPELQEQSGSRPEVALTLKGKPGAELTHGNIQVTARVSPRDRQPDGTYLVKLSSKNVRISDRRFSLHTIDFPEEGNLRLNLLTRGERQIPVKAVFDGNVPAGIKLVWETIPEKILVTGPENVLTKLKHVYTKRIPLTDAPEFFEFNTNVSLPQNLGATPDSVLVRVKLLRQYSNRSMHLPVSLLTSPGAPAATLVTPLPEGAEVLLRGSAAQLAILTPDQIRIYADAVGLNTPGRCRLPLRCTVNVPEVEMVSIVPGEVEIQLTSKTSK